MDFTDIAADKTSKMSLEEIKHLDVDIYDEKHNLIDTKEAVFKQLSVNINLGKGKK